MKPLSERRVLLVGAGGLGCPAALALASAGVGVLAVVDDDRIALTNLHRQILFSEADVGRPKAEVLAEALSRTHPAVHVVAHRQRLSPETALSLISACDLVVEGADNYPTKFLAADAAFLSGVPIVHGAAVRWHGTAFAVGPQGGPCYRCLFEDIPVGTAESCEEVGVFGPCLGVLGAAQADLAFGLLEGRGAGRLLSFDGRALRARWLEGPRRGDCPLCSAGGSIRTIARTQYEGGAQCVSQHHGQEAG